MPTLKLRFPGGRYHATPWGHHVNEGLIEWPPSPWRLLRALIACGFSSQGWSEIPETARRLIDKLAAVLPAYRLPPASAAHSRHFMPYIEGKNQRTTLVFDTWANIGDGDLFIHWPCELNADELALLSQLSAALGYLGRSESWVEAELTSAIETIPESFNAYPHQDGSCPGRNYEQVSLMAAIPPEEYQGWYQRQTQAAIAPYPLPEGKKKPAARLLKERERAIAPFPPNLISCLTKDTIWWKGHGWSQPPGSRRVLYWRRSDSLQVSVAARSRTVHYQPITTMLLSLTTPSGNRASFPACARTLPQAELIHRALVSRVANGQRVNCPELTGKDKHGQPLHDHHEHAHTLPVDLDGDGRLDHVIIFSKMGLNDAAQRAIRSLRRTWTKGGAGDIQLAVVGSGDLEILRLLPSPINRQVERLLGPEGGCLVWESITPFIFSRFLKPRGKNSILGQINAEVASRQLPAVNSVHVNVDLTRKLRWFVRRRSRRGIAPPIDAGYGLQLTFHEPVQGPLLLGYGSHYGLGMFSAISRQT